MNHVLLQPSIASPMLNGFGMPEVWAHRDFLVNFARRKLIDPTLAEDVVHDVFEAVLEGKAMFAGRSALRSWLVGILKNKLVDLIRDRARYQPIDADGDDQEGEWAAMVCPGAQPDELAEQRERLAVVMGRIQQLPEGLRDVMEWRVLNDEPTEAVCERLGISQDSLFVRLHRARKRLIN